MFHQTLWTQWAPIMYLSWVQRTCWNKSRKKSYDFLKIGLLHKYGVHYEFHVNRAIFKKSKNGQKPHNFKNHFTRCFTNISKLDLGWSNFRFTIFVYPSTSPLCLITITTAIIIMNENEYNSLVLYYIILSEGNTAPPLHNVTENWVA